MWLTTFAKGGIVGAATGFIFGFAFSPICPVDLPFWGLWLGIPIGGVLFLILSESKLRTILIVIWVPALFGLIISLLSGITLI